MDANEYCLDCLVSKDEVFIGKESLVQLIVGQASGLERGSARAALMDLANTINKLCERFKNVEDFRN